MPCSAESWTFSSESCPGPSPPHALAWYRAKPLQSFGDMTAKDLVRKGRSSDVHAYLARIATGGYV